MSNLLAENILIKSDCAAFGSSDPVKCNIKVAVFSSWAICTVAFDCSGAFINGGTFTYPSIKADVYTACDAPALPVSVAYTIYLCTPGAKSFVKGCSPAVSSGTVRSTPI